MLALANASALATSARHAVDALPPPVRAGVVSFARLLLALATLVVLAPLKGLYMNGPTLGGYGFWGGAEPADICAQLTGLSATVWLSSPVQALQCDALLERKFLSFAWSVFATAYLWGLYNLVSYAWYRYWVLRPAMTELRAALGIDHGRGLMLRVPRSPPPWSPVARRHLVYRTPTPPRPKKPHPDDD